MASGLLLAIETSQHRGGVALRGLDGAIHVEPVDTELHLDDDLIAAIDRLCRRVGITSGELGAVGVSIGPGGFTGLRIAVSTAKMLAETLGVRLVAVPTALVVAESHDGDGPILVALAAKGDRFWGSRLARRGDRWTEIAPPGPASHETLDTTELTAVLADRHLPAATRTLLDDAGISVVEPRFDPAACAAVAARWLAEDRLTDPLALTPIYARQPEAVALWDRRERRADPRR